MYLPFAREHHAEPAHDEFRCDVLKAHFGNVRFSQITMMSVIGFINERLKSRTVRTRLLEDGTSVAGTRSPTTVSKEVTLLSSIFRMAIAKKVATANPCEGLPKSVRSKIPARRRRKRRLSWEEERALFDSGLVGRSEHLRPIVEVALYTGMRKGELFGLRHEDLNFGSAAVSRVIDGEVWDVPPGWLLIVKSKSGRPRVIPMSRRVRRIMLALCEDVMGGEHVFRSVRTGGRITDIKKGFVSARREAGVTNFTFHDLRHTWASRAAELGTPKHVREEIMGHTPKSMADEYTHASPEELERAMESVAAYAGANIFDLGRISAKQEATAEGQSAVAS